MARRTILKFDRLYDVSPVYDPAYLGTSVDLDRRGYDEMVAKEEAEKRAAEEARKAELAEYFDELEKLLP